MSEKSKSSNRKGNRMQINRSDLLALVQSLPENFKFPEEWPTPSNSSSAYARVMSFDVLNHMGQPPVIQINMQKVDEDGASHQPGWQKVRRMDQLEQDPQQAPVAMLAVAALTVLAGLAWGLPGDSE